MTEAAGGKPVVSYRNLSEDLRREFLDEAVETLDELDGLLENGRNGHVDESEVVQGFRRAALRLRGQAGNFGLSIPAMVARRMDDYLAQASSPLPPRAWDDLRTFVEKLATLFGQDEDADIDTPALARALPRKLGFDLGDIEIRNVEVLLVMPQGAQTHFVEREMQQCGYRTLVVSDTVDAFGLVVQSKPDLVVVSAMMPNLDGIDLAIGLASMPSTRNIPIAVITSLSADDERLALLPRRIPILYKGPQFGDDLFKALDDLFLI